MISVLRLRRNTYNLANHRHEDKTAAGVLLGWITADCTDNEFMYWWTHLSYDFNPEKC